MFTTRDFDGPFELMDHLRRRMEWAFDDFEPVAIRRGRRGPFPPTNLHDAGSAFVLRADLPGLSEQDLTLTLTQDVLMIKGVRKVDPPEGYSAHMRERSAFEFSRSFALPTKVDPERTRATLKDGVLTVTLEKAAEARPRQIAVNVP